MKLLNIFIIVIISIFFSSKVFCEEYLSAYGQTSIGGYGIYHYTNYYVNFYLNSRGAGDGISYSDTYNELSAALQVWTAPTYSQFSYSLSSTTAKINAGDGQNTIFFAEDGDPEYGPYGIFTYAPNTGGFTFVTVNANNEIIDADVLMNGKNKTWVVNSINNPYRPDELRGIFIHEAGHTLGLGDLAQYLPSTMSIYCSGDPRTLESDDVVGICYLFGGNFIRSESFSRTLYFDWPITITSGTTIGINSSGNINVNNGARISVNGTLNISNGSFNFGSPNSSAGNGIIYLSGSSGSVSGATISNAQYGVNVEQTSNINITNSNIHDCFYGIRLISAGSPEIYNNTINSNYFGIYTNSTNPIITYNTITSNSGDGIYSGPNSNTMLGSSSAGGYNNIRSNNLGIYIANNNTVLGQGSSYGYNAILSNSNYDVYAALSGVLYAQNNYWGGGSGNNYVQNGAIVTNPYLTTDPIIGARIAQIESIEKEQVASYNICSNLNSNSTNISDISEKLYNAYTLYNSGNYREVTNICKDIIALYPKSPEVYNAIALLLEIGKNDKEIAKYLAELTHGNVKDDLRGYIELTLALSDNSMMSKNLDNLINTYGKSKTSELASFYKISYLNDIKNDKNAATELWGKMKKDYPESNLASKLGTILSGKSNKNILIKPSSGDNSSQICNYNLFDNFPNPFNPSTKIRFSIPEDNLVTIKIFDSVGREVAVLANEFTAKGTYELSFNAGNLPSGIYFCRMKAGNYSETKKMLLMK